MRDSDSNSNANHKSALGSSLFGALAVIAALSAAIYLFRPQSLIPVVQASPTALVTEVANMNATAIPTAATPTPEVPGVYQVRPGDTLASIALKTGVKMIDLRDINGLPPGSDVTGGQTIRLEWPDEAAFTPQAMRGETRTDVPSPEPLTAQSSPEDIIARALATDHYWASLWYESIFYVYGPSNYVGQPDISVVQGGAYSSAPYYWFAVAGPVSSPPAILETQLQDTHRSYEIPFSTGRIIARNNETVKWPGADADDLAIPLYRPFPVPAGWLSSWRFDVVGVDQVAGRQAVIIQAAIGEPLDTIKIWLDAETGLFLRIQGFDRKVIYLEMLVHRVAFNVELPVVAEVGSDSRMFGYSRDETGQPYGKDEAHDLPPLIQYPGHQPREHVPPPAGYDIASANLEFQWRYWPGIGGAGQSGQYVTEVFAGEYYLGSVTALSLGQDGPRDANVCDRSSDGWRLAYVDRSGERPVLAWLSFENPQQVNLPNLGLGPGDYLGYKEIVFAPDGDQLAVAACHPYLAECAIYRLDLPTNAFVRLFITDVDPRGLTWSPDGSMLALLEGDIRHPQVVVIDAQSGEQVFRGEYALAKVRMPADSPTLSWGVEFPPPESDRPCWENPETFSPSAMDRSAATRLKASSSTLIRLSTSAARPNIFAQSVLELA
ncbi:MAG: LysM peptidoglycan-binding domain-containing protein [Chloroflexota bacterium]|nr:MAG: LysM peptidoglycan-binding domain-containing protein [Chloroflexota bacterium]